MAFSFNGVEHFFAKALKVLVGGEPKAVTVIQDFEKAKPIVEGITAAVGQGALIPLEDAIFAIAGSVVSLLNAGEAAAEKKLLDAGLDQTAVDAAKSIVARCARPPSSFR